MVLHDPQLSLIVALERVDRNSVGGDRAKDVEPRGPPRRNGAGDKPGNDAQGDDAGELPGRELRRHGRPRRAPRP